MGSKISELRSVISTDNLEEGLIPIVIEDALGNKLNRKFTLLQYWTNVLQRKVADECELHKSTYNFGGSNEGGGEGGGDTPSEDIEALSARVTTVENFIQNLNTNYYPFSSGDNLNNAFVLFRDSTYPTAMAGVQSSLSGLNDDVTNLKEYTDNKFYIEIVDKQNQFIRAYSYSPKEGLKSDISSSSLPNTGVIVLRTDELATAMYHMELITAVRASYDVNSAKYTISIGTLQLSKPTQGTMTNYTGGNITTSIKITPSWDVTSILNDSITLDSGIVGTYNPTWDYPSATDQLIDNRYFTIQLGIGNWRQTYTLSKNTLITGNISTDITAAQ